MITKGEAKKRSIQGWNIRCNLCGNYGASWIYGARPGWGALALCPEHEKEYKEMIERHKKEIRKFTNANFEQDPWK